MIIKLKQGDKLYLKNIPEVIDDHVPGKFIHDQLLSLYYEKANSDKIEPFKMSYGRGDGIYITANAFVGIIRYDSTTLVIEPKIPELDIGKILYLSSISKTDQGLNESGSLFESLLADEEELNFIDYFIVPFLEALQDIFRNGIITEYTKESKQSRKLKGRLDINRQIKKSPAFEKFHTIQNKNNPDIVVNRVLLKATTIALSKTKLSWTHSYLKEAIENFQHVNDEEIIREDFTQLLSEYTTLKRYDYEEALLLAQYIIFGFDPTQGDNYDLFPEYLIDLNKVFESYVILDLSRVFKKGLCPKARFTLGISPDDPPLEDRHIELDGFYNIGSNVVIDAKNKYNGLITSRPQEFLPSNTDIYQQFYYAMRTESKHVVLIYPSTRKYNRPINSFEVVRKESPTIKFYCWGLKVTGTPNENRKAVESLAQFIDELN